MATLMSIATGNFTSSSTWAVCNSTAELDSVASNTALTTSYVTSSTFTPGAITIDGIAVRLASRAASPTGTISVALDQGGATVVGTEVTINVSDLPTAGTSDSEGGWIFFKFAAPVLLLAATAYSVKAKTSSSSQVNLYRNATAGNWSRELRTTTTATPATGDNLLINGEFTGAGTSNSITVTMDETSTSNDYGIIYISRYGTLTYGTSASTNYYLRVSGNIWLYNGATLNIGTTGTPIPSTSTATLSMDSTATSGSTALGIFVKNGASFIAQGNTVNNVYARLDANASATNTVLTVDRNTGWVNGDTIVVSSTTRTRTQYDERTVSSSSSTTVTVSSGLTYAHSGVNKESTNYGKALIINLTRNVKIQNENPTYGYVIRLSTSANLDFDYVWVRDIATSGAVSGSIGIHIAIDSTGSANFYGCSLSHGANISNSGMIYIVSGNNSIVTIDNCVFYKTEFPYGIGIIPPSSTTGQVFNINNVYAIYSGNNISTGGIIYYNNGIDKFSTLNINNVIISSVFNGCYITKLYPNPSILINNVEVFSGAGLGIRIAGYSNCENMNICNIACWHNNDVGFRIGDYCPSFYAKNIVCFGNNLNNIQISNTEDVYLKNVDCRGSSDHSTSYGLIIDRSSVIISSGNFGASTTHTSADLAHDYFTNSLFDNVLLNSSTPIMIDYISSRPGGSNKAVHFDRYQQIDNNYYSVNNFGSSTRDTTIKKSSVASQRITPNSSIAWFKSDIGKEHGIQLPLNSGSLIAVSIDVRASQSGDGTVYNGSPPYFYVRDKVSCGIEQSIIGSGLGTFRSGWETIYGNIGPLTRPGVISLAIECSGSQGWLNVDNFVLHSGELLNNLNYDVYDNGLPFVVANSGGTINNITTGIKYHPGMMGGMRG